MSTHTADKQDPFFKEELDFDNHDAAQAQFWTAGRHNNEPGLRITIPERGYEFSNGAYIGRDPVGMFHYDDLSDIDSHIGRQTKFKVTTKGSGTNTYVNVIFYKDDDVPFGRFVGRDPAQVAMANGFVDKTERGKTGMGKTGMGKWTQPGFGSTTATFHKDSGSSTAYITGKPAHLMAKFKLAGDDIVGKKIDVKGRLRYHNEDLVGGGVRMRWNTDHFVFFRDDVFDHASDYTAYFMAFNDTELTELMPQEHQNETFVAEWVPRAAQP
ncbi:hypothetical protein JVT61DRAFT_4850 [Boletus reticuloceps]|uniref:Uncharacterized protein n=1 Tax=Boletus reticuloceps TaxID=495285 RepID=A0A8I3A8T3_9AGAM|nr:hypothetical protein JVT61DRAFT_4850 [Boletus reticuloceps]